MSGGRRMPASGGATNLIRFFRRSCNLILIKLSLSEEEIRKRPQRMTGKLTDSSPSRAAQLLFVLLAISVFTWGLQYKLSLYHASNSVEPAVKLLSCRELPVWSSGQDLAIAPSLPVVPVSSPASTSRRIPFAFTCRRTELVAPQVRALKRLQFLQSISSRPPPQSC